MSITTRQSLQRGRFGDTQLYDYWSKLRQACFAVRKLLLYPWKRPYRLWCALRVSVRTFRGHIQELLSRKRWAVDLGPVYLPNLDGHLLVNSRVQSRNAGIETLIQSRSWANTIDIEIFLQGFDWGEQYALSKSCTQSNIAFEEPCNRPLSNLGCQLSGHLKKLVDSSEIIAANEGQWIPQA